MKQQAAGSLLPLAVAGDVELLQVNLNFVESFMMPLAA